MRRMGCEGTQGRKQTLHCIARCAGSLFTWMAIGLLAAAAMQVRADAGEKPGVADNAIDGAHSLPPKAAGEETAAPARGVRVLEINGDIRPALVQQVRNALKDVDGRRYPAGALLLLNSRGGDGMAAMQIGRIVRAAKAHTFVRGRCASACVFILAGGVVRSAPAGHGVGIHRPRLSGFVKGVGIVDIDPASNPNAAAALEAGNLRSQAFLREMGLPDALFQAMMATPSGEMRYLNAAELSEFGLSGFDAAYRDARAPEAAGRYGVTAEEFVRRTLLVPDRCAADTAAPQEFVRCYRRVLEKGE